VIIYVLCQLLPWKLASVVHLRRWTLWARKCAIWGKSKQI